MKTIPDLASLYHLIIRDTPLGNIHCSARSKGLVSLAFYTEANELMNDTPLPETLRKIKEEIIAYFKGNKQGFTTGVDLSKMSGFQQDVLMACKEIPFGEVRTYGELAKAVGKSGAAQAVGGVMARNPIPLVIPCHRVIAADGGLHGYSASGGLKQNNFYWLLRELT